MVLAGLLAERGNSTVSGLELLPVGFPFDAETVLPAVASMGA